LLTLNLVLLIASYIVCFAFIYFCYSMRTGRRELFLLLWKITFVISPFMETLWWNLIKSGLVGYDLNLTWGCLRFNNLHLSLCLTLFLTLFYRVNACFYWENREFSPLLVDYLAPLPVLDPIYLSGNGTPMHYFLRTRMLTYVILRT
jgi:hypothetical protein